MHGSRKNTALGWMLALAPFGLIAGPPAQAQAVTTFSNFDPANSFDGSASYNERGPDAPINSFYGFYISQGEGFTPTVSGSLASITIPLGAFSGPNDLDLFLADGQGGVPGNTMESFHLTDLPSYLTPATVTVTSVSQPSLVAGNTYFLYASEPGAEENLWFKTSTGQTGIHITSRSGAAFTSANNTQGAFSVQVTPAPEVSQISVLGLGFLCIVGQILKAHKRKSVA